MKTYRITNAVSGADLGTYEADSEQGALDAMARDAGYADHAAAQEAAPTVAGELAVRELDAEEAYWDRQTRLAYQHCAIVWADAPCGPTCPACGPAATTAEGA